MLSEGREEVKRLMILQRDTTLVQTQQLLEQQSDPHGTDYYDPERETATTAAAINHTTRSHSNSSGVVEVDDEVVRPRTLSDLNSVTTHDHDTVQRQIRETNRQQQLHQILTQQEADEQNYLQRVEAERQQRLSDEQRAEEARVLALQELQSAQESQQAQQRAENERLIAKLQEAIEVIKVQTAETEKALLAEEARLCIDESTNLTSSVSAVYNSLLTQNLPPEKLLEEQEKVAVWEQIQRKKQLKQAARRKAALKVQIADVKGVANDKLVTLSMELQHAVDHYYSPTGVTLQSIQHLTEPFYPNQYLPEESHNNDSNDAVSPSEETEAERKIKDYSRAQFELHSHTQRELHDKQQALMMEIANKKAQMVREEAQRVENIRLEKEAAIQRELDRIEQIRLDKEAALRAEEERLQKIADDERLAQEQLEMERQAEVLRLWLARKEDLEQRVRERLVVRIQQRFRAYQQRLRLHRAITVLQKVVRSYLVQHRIKKHFQSAIVAIENQSARIITHTLREYVQQQRLKFRGREIMAELLVVSVLEMCLQRREILILSNKLTANRKKKGVLRDSMQERQSQKLRRKEEKAQEKRSFLEAEERRRKEAEEEAVAAAEAAELSKSSKSARGRIKR